MLPCLCCGREFLFFGVRIVDAVAVFPLNDLTSSAEFSSALHIGDASDPLAQRRFALCGLDFLPMPAIFEPHRRNDGQPNPAKRALPQKNV